MSLKHIIKHAKLRALMRNDIDKNKGYFNELTLPGEPLIYCIKYPVGKRHRGWNFFRNQKFHSLIKCWFRSYTRTNIPVVLLVRFFVSVPDYVKVPAKDVKSEKIPATYAFELCDYILSFMEMINRVLIGSYKQIVKLDIEKYYSNNPRTVFKFMKWEHYGLLQDHYTNDTQSESEREIGAERLLQSKSKRDESHNSSGQEITENDPLSRTINRSSLGNRSLQNTCLQNKNSSHKDAPTSKASSDTPRRRQPRKVSQ